VQPLVQATCISANEVGLLKIKNCSTAPKYRSQFLCSDAALILALSLGLQSGLLKGLQIIIKPEIQIRPLRWNIESADSRRPHFAPIRSRQMAPRLQNLGVVLALVKGRPYETALT